MIDVLKNKSAGSLVKIKRRASRDLHLTMSSSSSGILVKNLYRFVSRVEVKLPGMLE